MRCRLDSRVLAFWKTIDLLYRCSIVNIVQLHPIYCRKKYVMPELVGMFNLKVDTYPIVETQPLCNFRFQLPLSYKEDEHVLAPTK